MDNLLTNIYSCRAELCLFCPNLADVAPGCPFSEPPPPFRDKKAPRFPSRLFQPDTSAGRLFNQTL